MISRNILIKIMIMIIIAIFGTIIGNNLLSPQQEEKQLFPGILGDTTLTSNETGKYAVADIISYDDFRGDIIQGYKATYSSGNETMIIFIAQMSDNMSANKSLKDMVYRAGYNESAYNESDIPILDENNSIIRLPVTNPEVFAIQKARNETLHYTFYKKDKVYWIGLSDLDIEYQANMLIEIYKNVDK